uniref:Germ cell nuclear acidic peptidase n=1 Tax=Callithrix jacchus TaxID=9483 RepID=F7HLT2_CALJA
MGFYHVGQAGLELLTSGKNMEGYNVKPTILTIQGPLIVISDDDDDDDKNSNDLEVLKEESNDSDVPKDKSNDSDVPDDDDNHDLDVPDDDDKYDSDVPDDDHDSDVLDDDDNHDSDVPDDDHDSDVLDEDSNDSDVLSDSNDWEVPDNSSDDLEVPMPAEDSCDEGQIASDEEELDEAGEQDLGENLCHPPSDPEANLEVSKRKLPTEEEPATVVGQSGKRKAKSETIVEPLKQQKAEIESVVEPPRKRKAKTKNISVTPADKGHKKCGHSKKKPGAAKVENHKTRYVLLMFSRTGIDCTVVTLGSTLGTWVGVVCKGIKESGWDGVGGQDFYLEWEGPSKGEYHPLTPSFLLSPLSEAGPGLSAKVPAVTWVEGAFLPRQQLWPLRLPMSFNSDPRMMCSQTRHFFSGWIQPHGHQFALNQGKGSGSGEKVEGTH